MSFEVDEFPASFTLDVSRNDISSDSESDFELPAFDIPAFHKHTDSGKLIGGKCSLNKGNEFYVNVYPDSHNTRDRIALQRETLSCRIKETEKKIVTKPGFETLEKVPTFLSRRQSKKLGMKEKDKSKGFNWYNMPAPEMTEEIKNDLTVVQMRKALDPKHFYKRSALNSAKSKYFQVGTYEESPLDYYSSRVPKKQRKKTLVEELMADAEFRSYQKKKVSEALRSQPPKKFHKNSKQSKVKTSKVKKTKVNSEIKKQKFKK